MENQAEQPKKYRLLKPEAYINGKADKVYSENEPSGNHTVGALAHLFPQDWLLVTDDTQTAVEANDRIGQCVEACAGVNDPQPNELGRLRAQLTNAEDLAASLITELNDRRVGFDTNTLKAVIKPSKYIILNLQNLETYKGVDGYTETFGEESQAIDVAQQFVGMFQIIPVNI